MKRSSKTTSRDGAPRSAAERVLREVSERPVRIPRTVTCLVNLERCEQNVGRKKKRSRRRKEIWSIASRRKGEREGRKQEEKRKR